MVRMVREGVSSLPVRRPASLISWSSPQGRLIDLKEVSGMRVRLFALPVLILVSGALICSAQPRKRTSFQTIKWVKTVIDDGENGPGGIATGRPYHPVPPILKGLYCASMDGDLVEYLRDPSSPTQWLKRMVLSGVNFRGITIGRGRNDASERMYCLQRQKLYEVWCESGVWTSNLLLELTDTQFSYVVIGQGRNDGVNRVYASSDLHKIYELTYVGPGPTDWDIQTIDLDMMCEDIGEGRNDGVNRIYGIGGNDEWTIYELTYNAGTSTWERKEVWTWQWQEEPIPTVCGGVSLGNARRYETIVRIYYLDVYDGTDELVWGTGAWIHEPVEANFPFRYYYGRAMGEWGRPYAFGTIGKETDPPIRLLFIAGEKADPPDQEVCFVFAYSYRHDTHEWVQYTVGDAGLWGADLAWGDVRQPGDFALYVVSMDGHLVEFYPKVE